MRSYRSGSGNQLIGIAGIHPRQKMLYLSLLLATLLAQQVPQVAARDDATAQRKDKRIDREVERLIRPAKSSFYAMSNCFDAISVIEDDNKLDAALLDCMRRALNRLPDDRLRQMTRLGIRGELRFGSIFGSLFSKPCAKIRFLAWINKRHLKSDESVHERNKLLMLRDICLVIKDGVRPSELYRHFLTTHRPFRGAAMSAID